MAERKDYGGWKSGMELETVTRTRYSGVSELWAMGGGNGLHIQVCLQIKEQRHGYCNVALILMPRYATLSKDP